MSAEKWVLGIVGTLLLLAGIVFALQGAYGIGGGSVMDNNPMWVYIGTAIAVVGVITAAVGFRMRSPKPA
jgi:hypothetical protein